MVSQYNSNRHTRVDRKVLWWSRNRRTPSALARRATEEDAPECGRLYPAAIRVVRPTSAYATAPALSLTDLACFLVLATHYLLFTTYEPPSSNLQPTYLIN